MTRHQDILKHRAEEYAEQTRHIIIWRGSAWELEHDDGLGLPVYGDTPGELCMYLRGYQNGAMTTKRRIAEMVAGLAEEGNS